MHLIMIIMLPTDPQNAYQNLSSSSLLEAWEHSGALSLVEIDWQTSPPELLKRLIAAEAVHPIGSMEELQHRLRGDRKIYALLHREVPLEPIVFTEVAWVRGLASNIQALLDPAAPMLPLAQADTAIFYSISNAQNGLKGIRFGNFLIQKVVATLVETHPHITTFATLSPIPGLRPWLDASIAEDGASPLTASEQGTLTSLTGHGNLQPLLDSAWHEDATIAAALQPILMRRCAQYLLHAKQPTQPLEPLDAVAKFHLFNGARLEQLNWLADISAKGLRQSAGIMVNYRYYLPEMAQNHEDFSHDGKIVASSAVRGYL